MYCKNCGKEISDNVNVCPECEQPTENVNISVNNTESLKEMKPITGRPKNKVVSIILCIFFGWLGAHRFYEGKIGTGILYLLTFGVFGFGIIADLILLIQSPNPYYSGKNTCRFCGKEMKPNEVKCLCCEKQKLNTGAAIGGAVVIMIVLSIISGAGKRNKTNETVTNDTTSESSVTEDKATEKDKETKETVPEKEMKYEVTNIIFNTYTDSIGSTYYDGIVEITNTGNVPIYLDDCTYDFEDNEGHLIKTENSITQAPPVVQPGEKGYFFPISTLMDESISNDDLKLVPNVSIEEAKGTYNTFEISDVSIRNESLGDMTYPVITGRVTNNTDKDESLIDIAIVFFDSNNKPFAVERTYSDEVKANGGRGSFEISCALSTNLRDRPESDFTNYKIFAGDFAHIQF